MKKFWLNKEDCSGCGMCANACPKHAIVVKEDKCGFYYPEILKNCINCNACEKVCLKRLTVKRDNPEKPITYVTWSKDDTIRYNSTSGGAFSELVLPILNSNGYVIGAEYDTDNTVKHSIIHRADDLKRLRQSKYVQSLSGDIYNQVKMLLKDNNQVAFCGTPCQVAALYAYLGKNYDSLYTIDFICRGVNSPKAFRSWLSEIESEMNSKVSRVWFKYKENGWKTSPLCTRLDFKNGEHKIISGKANLFMYEYLTSNLFIRPSCSQCHFKGSPRLSDITLADFWGLEADLDDDKGSSLLMANSTKGLNMLNNASMRVTLKEQSFEKSIQANPCFLNSVVLDNQRNARFLESLSKYSFSKAIEKEHSYKESVIQRIKRRLLSIR